MPKCMGTLYWSLGQHHTLLQTERCRCKVLVGFLKLLPLGFGRA